ncbi:hypothetical protein MH117_09910 [Paenibacillus sp. ACRRX]|nr:hypothetical protein [Paenibacillus sp. ACRRX]MCG7407738.1 hypothetical protein [Paenibacillus sp. ACRRX]
MKHDNLRDFYDNYTDDSDLYFDTFTPQYEDNSEDDPHAHIKAIRGVKLA